MKNSFKTRKIETKLAYAVFQTLIKRLPANVSSKHLEELAIALTEALYHGEIYITLKEDLAPIGINRDDWPKEHFQALISSGWIEKEDSPMILIDNKLSWRRWHEEIDQIMTSLIKRSEDKSNITNQEVINRKINVSSSLNAEQISAVQSISNHNVILLSGGPGTGKTTTIVEMLINALSNNQTLKVGLSAPTGKATRRLQETIQNYVRDFHTPYKNILLDIPSFTLHKWLQANETGFAKNKANPLFLDLLVIDEMSMVDLALMQGLLETLPNRSQLILVGDANQLAPVGSGSIWNKLQEENTRKYFKKGAIHLHKLYRNSGDIASLSTVIQEKGLSSFWERLNKLPKSSNVSIIRSTTKNIPKLIFEKISIHHQKLKGLSALFAKYLIKNSDNNSKDIDIKLKEVSVNIFNLLEELVVLCPKRYGPWGVDHIHRSLLGSKLVEGFATWANGTPVICGENQSELGLANGDIGITIRKEDNLHILFQKTSDEEGQTFQIIHPARIRKLDPAFAITIHKAQGSECKHVILMWPDQAFTLNSSPFKQSEDYDKRLIYTAITRARKKLDLIINSNN